MRPNGGADDRDYLDFDGEDRDADRIASERLTSPAEPAEHDIPLDEALAVLRGWLPEQHLERYLDPAITGERSAFRADHAAAMADPDYR